MQPHPLSTRFSQNVSFVDVLADQRNEIAIGYRFGGDRPGPNALFVAMSPTIDAVSQRLAEIPTLPWMWGRLYLVAVDLLDNDQNVDVTKFIPNVLFDEVSVFPHTELKKVKVADLNAGYWAALRLCSGLGMIQGRGVKT